MKKKNNKRIKKFNVALLIPDKGSKNQNFKSLQCEMFASASQITKMFLKRRKPYRRMFSCTALSIDFLPTNWTKSKASLRIACYQP